MATPAEVPLVTFDRQVKTLRPQLLAAFERVMDSGHFILGPEVQGFEREAAAWMGAKHAVGVANGTDAIWLSLRAAGVGPGDKVIVPPFTFFATASAVLNTGATPVFADIDPATFNIDTQQVAAILDGKHAAYKGLDRTRVKAIVPVHLYGQACDIDAVTDLARRHKLAVVEDAAQAIGARHGQALVGTFGDYGAFSMFPTKNLGAFGDAGFITAMDDAKASKVRLLRAHGSEKKYWHEAVGSNSRLDALQAAILRVKLPHLRSWIEARQAHAKRYDTQLKGIAGLETPTVAQGRDHTYHQYTVRIAGGRRDAVADQLKKAGIGTATYYPTALHQQPALAGMGFKPGSFPHSETACREALSLPMFPEMTREEQDRVVDALRASGNP